ncbi:MAG: hypothetical protein U0Q15_08170 [Kineosporiaceae bacterium]
MPKPRPLATTAAGAAVLAASLLCGACSSGQGDVRAAATSSTTKPPGPAHPLDGKEAGAVLAAARGAMASAPVLRLQGLIGSGAEAVTFDVTGKPDGQGQGTISEGAAQGSARIVVVGSSAYLSGDDTYTRRAAGPAAVAALRGKWVMSSRTDPSVAGLTRFLDRGGVASTALTVSGAGVVAPGSGTPGATVGVSADGKQFEVHLNGLVIAVSRDARTLPLSVREERPAPEAASSLTYTYPAGLTLQAPTAVVRRPAAAPGAATGASRRPSP